MDDSGGNGSVRVVAFGWRGDAGQAEGMRVWVSEGARGRVGFLERVDSRNGG